MVAQGKYLPSIKELLFIGITFSLTVFAWIFFRSASLSHAVHYISEIFSGSFFTWPTVGSASLSFLLVLFLIIEWLGREQQYAIAGLGLRWPKAVRLAMYYTIVLAIFYFAGDPQQFIYFQF